MLITLNTDILVIWAEKGTEDQDLYVELKNAWRNSEHLRDHHFPIEAASFRHRNLTNYVIKTKNGWRIRYV